MAKILLVDDDENIHQIIPLFLEAAGHEVHCATSAPAGLELLSNERPDLILLDMAMPGMDGREFLETLKTQDNMTDIAVLVFTVHDLDELAPSRLDLNKVGYLRKPVNMKTLQASVDQALKGSGPHQ